MAGSFGQYIQQVRSGAIYPEVPPSDSSAGEGQDANEPTNYEQARANMSGLVPAAVASSWQAVDRDEQLLRQRVEQILSDDTRTPEFKAQEAQELYQRSATAIGERRRQVKADLQKASDASYRASV